MIAAEIRMQPATLALIRDRKVAKGDVFEVARLAGIMAAKRTSELIPLCHPLPITGATVELSLNGGKVSGNSAWLTCNTRSGR